MRFRWYYHHYQGKVTVSLSSTIETSVTLSALSYLHVHKETKCGLLFSQRKNKATERDSEGVGWDILILQKLFVDWPLNGRLFPETSA